MNRQEHQEGSQLFTLRVWIEDVGDGRLEMRGTIRHVLSGETRHFRDTAVLLQFIEQSFKETMVQAPGGKS
jgi:hypothetical protein